MTTRRSFMVRTPIVLAAAGAQARGAAEAPSRRLLTGRFPLENLARVLLPRERWLPFAPASTRAGWEALPAPARKDLVAAGERHLGKEWPLLPASVFLEYARDGNRSRYEAIRSARRERLRELVVAECVEAKGRFTDEVVNGVWATCEETFWGVPAHLSLQKAGSGLPDVTEPVVDLFAAETASLLAWTDYLLGPQLGGINKLLRPRVQYEMQRRILVPNLERNDFWWMGFDPKRASSLNNWTPWIDSNWLTAALLMEPDEKRRVTAVHKILRSLDRFLDGYADDGGCDEGPGYWGRAGGSLFDCLELLYSATGGAADFYREPLIQEIGRYIYRVHIAGDWFINFADASARNRINPELVFRYGKAIADEKMQAMAGYAAAGRGDRIGADSLGRQLAALFLSGGLASVPARPPLVRDAWMPGIQVMAARAKEGSTDGLYLAAQGGHNAESHNHNDVGNFIVFAGGQPVIIDVGVETYTAKTFSGSRYDIWTMQSAYHNLPTIGRVMQGRRPRVRCYRRCLPQRRPRGGVQAEPCARLSPRSANPVLEPQSAAGPCRQRDHPDRRLRAERGGARYHLDGHDPGQAGPGIGRGAAGPCALAV